MAVRKPTELKVKNEKWKVQPRGKREIERRNVKNGRRSGDS